MVEGHRLILRLLGHFALGDLIDQLFIVEQHVHQRVRLGGDCGEARLEHRAEDQRRADEHANHHHQHHDTDENL